jgi:hypothetical protein
MPAKVKKNFFKLKGTYIRQLKNIYLQGFKQDELLKYVPIIHQNVYEIFYSMIKFAEKQTNVKIQSTKSDLKVEIHEYKTDEVFDDIIGHIINVVEKDEKKNLNENNFQILLDLFSSHPMKLSYSRKYEFNLMNSVDM